MKKLLCFIATFSLLTNTLLAPISVLAEESPTPESTITPANETIAPTESTSSTPIASLDTVLTDEAVSTPTPEEAITETAPTATPEDIPSQDPESTPTVQGPPEASSTPTIAPESSEENTKLSAVILENEKIDTSVLDNFDFEYTEDGSASISTDKLDYSPTDTAVISGTGFIPEKTYTINVISSDEPAVDFKDTLTANDKGEILYSYTLDGNYRPDYQVKILDGDRVVAETTFTDSVAFNGDVGGWVGSSGLNVTGYTTGDYNTTITGVLTEYSNPTQHVSFGGTITGDIVGSINGGINYNGFYTLFAEITGSGASGHVY